MKKFLSVFLCVMLFALTLSSFAADTGHPSRTITLQSYNGQGGYVNVYSTTGPYQGVLLRTWPTGDGPDQKWVRYVEEDRTGNIYPNAYAVTYRAYANTALAMNRSTASAHNAILWDINTGYSDSLFYEDSSGRYLYNYGSYGYLNVLGPVENSQSGAYLVFGTDGWTSTSCSWFQERWVS